MDMDTDKFSSRSTTSFQKTPLHVTNAITVVKTEKEKRKKRICDAIKKIFKSLGSHIGLLTLVCIYHIIGAYVFQYLEETNEKHACYTLQNKSLIFEFATIEKLYDQVKVGLDEYETKVSFQKILEKFRNDMVVIGYDGTNCTMLGLAGGPQLSWSVPGALVFAVTVTTTIGYGNIAPKTSWGQITCIAYAVLGIPLMLLFLANVGDVMADLFKFLYAKICCCGCLRGRAIKPDDEAEEPTQAWRTETSGGKPGPPAKAPPLVVDDEEDDEEEEFDDENISIPLTVSMMIMATLILLGAALFSVWEGWPMLIASYFSFITISTIGFGDYVPGTDVSSPAAQFQLICAAIYMIFGMAILSMCFSLIQDEIATKFKWLGTKLGLIQSAPAEGEGDGV